MVKTYNEEEQSLSLKEIETLLTIFFGRIKDTYNQFRWKVEIIPSSGCGYAKTRINAIECYINVQMFFKKRFEVYIELVGKKVTSQNFPITEKTPKELEELANTMFKWVKKQIEKFI